MSYCRWSSENFQSDVYVYGAVSGGFVIHVADKRYKKEILDQLEQVSEPDESSTEEEFLSWAQALQRNMEKLSSIVKSRSRSKSKSRPSDILEDIDLPHAGQSIHRNTPGECAQALRDLRSLGYKVPEHALYMLDKEQEALDRDENR